MKIIKPSTFSEYFTKILKQYRSLQIASQDAAYRIVKIEEQKNKRIEFTIQIVGKNIIFKAYPEKLAADDKILENFTKQDVRTITYFACQEIKKPKYQILIKEFCSAFNKMIFSLKCHGNDIIKQTTAADISNDHEVLQELSPLDAHLIGYTAATEKNHGDKQQQQLIHDKTIPKHKIIKQEHSTTLNTTIYTLEEKISKQHQQKTAHEISTDKKLLKGLKQKDAHMVGFTSAQEQQNKEKK